MIGKVTRGGDTAGLLRYLYGPGRANEHINPHLVASWLGDDRAVLDPLEPARTAGLGIAGLATRLNLPLRLLPDQPDRPIWQCSMRTANGDRRLTDTEWATVAREVVERTGFAPAGDPGGCRWVAVRHSEDHIHIIVVLGRQDGGKVDTFRDWPKVHAAARAVEKRFSLKQVTSPDRAATPAPTRAEVEKAARLGKPEPARRWLAREVRTAAAGSLSQEQFATALTGRTDLLVAWRFSQQSPGEITGYRVGRIGDRNADGRQIWFSGSKLAPDLSLPRLQSRWDLTAGRTVPVPRKGSTDQRHRQVMARAERALGRMAGAPVDQEHIIAAAETATVISRLAEGGHDGPLTQAAEKLSRAGRLGIGINHRSSALAGDLRLVAAELSTFTPWMTPDSRAIALIAVHLARIAAALASTHSPTPLSPERRAAALQAADLFRGAATAPSGKRFVRPGPAGSDAREATPQPQPVPKNGAPCPRRSSLSRRR